MRVRTDADDVRGYLSYAPPRVILVPDPKSIQTKTNKGWQGMAHEVRGKHQKQISPCTPHPGCYQSRGENDH